MQEKKKRTRLIDDVMRPKRAARPILWRRRTFRLASLLVVVGIVIFAGMQIVSIFTQQQIDRSRYQAVYLVSGQMYFGKLVNKSGDYLTINDAYTVQQSGSDTASNEANKVKQEAATSIVKVSQQTYGPNDTIALNADQVLFWQNLRDDSKVVEAIKTDQ